MERLWRILDVGPDRWFLSFVSLRGDGGEGMVELRNVTSKTTDGIQVPLLIEQHGLQRTVYYCLGCPNDLR